MRLFKGKQGSSATGVAILALLLALALPATAFCGPLPAFGPKRYDKPKGGPMVYADTFTAAYPAGRYTLRVESGADGLQQVKNVSVAVNGVEMVDSADLRTANPATKALVLGAENVLTVTLKGQGGNFVTVEVLCEDCSPVRITSPAEGSTVSSPFATVKGELVNLSGAEVGVTVNGVTAQVNGNDFIASHVPLAAEPGPGNAGLVPITAVVTDAQGSSAETVIEVFHQPEPYDVTLAADRESGLAPLEVLFAVESNLPAPLSAASLVCSGPEAPAVVAAGKENFAGTFTLPGLYACTLSVTDAAGAHWQDTLGINVLSREAFDGLLQAKWNGMKEALAAGDIEGGVSSFNEGVREKYRSSFTRLGDRLPSVASAMQDIELVYVKGDIAKYRISRVQIFEGQPVTVAYYIYFNRNADGIWKIEQF